MFQPTDIKWIKNVKRDKGADWAYMEHNVGDVFFLHFPNNSKWYPTNYEKAKPGELIVIFQTVNEIEGANTYITHLVTPVDKNIVVDNSLSHPYMRYVALVAKADPPVLQPEGWNFKKPNRGQICFIRTIERKSGPDYSIEQKQQLCWDMFNNISVDLYSKIIGINNIELEVDDLVVVEGADRFEIKLHKYKERKRSIIIEAKKRAKESGKFFCEACTFSFETTYPILGENFIECHHRLPISKGGIRETSVTDIAIVCSNCHRMLHRKLDGKYMLVEELKSKFFS